jgi:hypothetical protein
LLKLTRTGEFTVVRVHSGPEGIGVWFRLVVGDSLPNYSDYQLRRNASGEVVARDVYETLTGQFVGEAMRPILADIVEHSSKSMVEKLTSVPLVSLKHKLAHMKFRKLVNSENHAAAVACYRELPEILQRDKSNLMLYVECASQLSTVEVDRAMAEARRYYSEDSLDGMFLAPHINQGNHLEAIGCVDRLSQRVGGDSRLSLLRTCLLIDAGKFEEARESALMLLDWTKSTDGYAACLCVATRTDNEAMMIELFETLLARDWTLPNFESEPYFSEFVASPRYKEWLRRQEVAERPEEPTAENEDAAEYSSWPRQL